MGNWSVTEIKQNIVEKEYVNLCWKDSLPIQHLLDTISSIIAEEYIMIAKQNHDVFLKQGHTKWKPQYTQDILQRIKAKKVLMIR